MKLKRTVLGPFLVAMVAFVSGGWLLQRGVAGEKSVFEQSRILDEVMQRVSRDYVEAHPTDELYKMAVDGFLKELGDPHTVFMTAEEYNNLRIQTTGEYGGLGIQISERDGWITVLAPLPGTPAERAGIQAGDRIVEVEGKSTEGWSDDDAVKVLRGPKGAPVHIKVGRIGVDEPIPFTIVRDEIHVKSVPSAYMVEPGIGYAQLTVFAETSTDELREAINKLRGQGMRGLILDLRTNPGGLLDQGVSVSDLFVNQGMPIVETRARDPRENVTYRSSQGTSVPNLPIVVLVDEYTASAAEIVAGALQDHDEALVVGVPTFGKGSVQTLFPLAGGNFLKMTTGKWYTPSGRSIQKDKKQLTDTTGVVDPVPGALTQPADTSKRKEYKTDAGRVVYGGGGIVPDLIVKPDTATAAEKEFFAAAAKAGSKFNNVLYRYALEYGKQHPNLAPNFAVTPAMREEFFRRLQEAAVPVTREQLQGATRFIDRRLGYEIALAKFGQSVASQRGNSEDAVVRTAVDLLRNASSKQALFRLAESRRTTQAAR